MDDKTEKAVEKAIASLKDMSGEELDDLFTQHLHRMYGGEEGYNWSMARKAARETEGAPDEVPQEMLDLQERLSGAQALLETAKAEMEDAHEALMQYGERRLGFKRGQKMKVRVLKDAEEGGYVYSFKFLENGTVLFGFAYGWGASGYFAPSDIVEIWEGDFASDYKA